MENRCLQGVSLSCHACVKLIHSWENLPLFFDFIDP